MRYSARTSVAALLLCLAALAAPQAASAVAAPGGKIPIVVSKASLAKHFLKASVRKRSGYRHTASTYSRTCQNCHTRPHQSFRVSCYNCHRSTRSWTARHSTSNSCASCHVKPAATHAGYPSASCFTCHKAKGKGWAFSHSLSLEQCGTCHQKDIPSTRHFTGMGLDCSDCHMDTSTWIRPGPHPVAFSCVTCHTAPHDSYIAEPYSGLYDCSLCHVAPAGSNWGFTHPNSGYWKLPCTICHVPPADGVHPKGNCQSCHSYSVPFQETPHPAESDCSSCHGDTAAEHAAKVDAPCIAVCHRGGGRIDTYHDSCDTCHASTDPAVVASIAAGDTACFSCHGNYAHDYSHAVVREDGCVACHPGTDLLQPHMVDGHTYCLACHESDEPAVKAAIHAGNATCGDCHGTAGHAADHAVLRTDTCRTCHDGSDLLAVHPGGCASCHSSADPAVRTAIRAGDPSCAACHGPLPDHESLHLVTRSDTCASCHAGNSLTALHGGCDGCHASTDPAVVSAIAAGSRACASCHAFADHAAEHAVQRTDTCADCHAGDNLLAVHPAGTECGSCHASADPAVLAAIAAGKTACSACHGFADHTPRHDVIRGDSCEDCHAGSNLVGLHGLPCGSCHGSDDPAVTAAVADGDTRCVACHAFPDHDALHAVTRDDACAECHPETNLVSVHDRNCYLCHESDDPAVTAAVLDGSTACTACHVRLDHGPVHDTVRDDTCVECHAGTNIAAMHAACGTCHDSSDPDVTAAVRNGHGECSACHDFADHSEAHRVFRSDTCVACHDGDNLTTVHAGTCDSCHENADPAVAAAIAAGDTACSSCHDFADHTAEHDTVVPAACGSCHDGTGNLLGIHDGLSCWTCHNSGDPSVTGAIEAGDKACGSCHAGGTHSELHAAAAPEDCQGCHEPPAGHDHGLLCGSCHAYAADGWEFQHPGDGDDCLKCHDAAEVGADHAACVPCHTGHTAYWPGVPDAGSDCLACHATATWTHTDTCLNCHGSTELRLLGMRDQSAFPFKPKSFATGRHDDSILVGKCTQCHADGAGTHPAPTADCSACHTAPAEHYADRCSTCHDRGTDFTATADPHAVPGSDCGSCHAAQHELLRTDSCQECHDGTNLTTVHEGGCDSCHKSSDPAVAGAIASGDSRCAACHAFPDHASLHVLERTDECVACHAGDDLTAAHTGDCDSCHGSSDPAVAAAIAAGGATCETCHPAHHDGLHETSGPDTCLAAGCHATPLLEVHDGVFCSGCHSSADPVVRQAILTGDTACTACHDAGVHDTLHESPNADCTVSGCHDATLSSRHWEFGCGTCHASEDPAVSGAVADGNLDCVACHADATDHAAEHAVTGSDTGCTTCHAGGFLSPHDRLECGTCHSSGSPAVQAAIARGSAACRDCHGGTLHAGIHDGVTEDSCTSCHTPPADHPADHCPTCHVPGTPFTGATHNPGRPCSDCHTAPAGHYAGTCSSCHAPQRSFASERSSGIRHEVTLPTVAMDLRITRAGHSPYEVSCGACHYANLETEHKGGCGTCHGSTAPAVVSAIASGDTGCTACHATYHAAMNHSQWCEACHDFDNNTPVDCGGCHTLVGDSEAVPHEARTDCQSCHAVPAGHASGACATCHSPSVPFADTQHPDASADCTSCHTAPAGHPTGLSCPSCHAAGTAPWTDATHPAQSAACAGCHTAPASHFGTDGTDCATCHNPAVPFADTVDPHAAGASCVACHELPASHPAGLNCVSCHTAPGDTPWSSATHPAQAAACGTCHEPPAGHYGPNCASCHDPATPFADTANVHVAGSDCAACHTAPHGGYLPTTCSGCHTAPGEYWTPITHPVRNDCTACHEAPLNHPAGLDCSACHVADAAGSWATASHPTAASDCTSCHGLPGNHPAGLTCTQCHVLGTQPFSAAQHPGSSTDCASCHSYTDHPIAGVDCYSCHGDHHGDGEDCYDCHGDPEHDNSVMAGTNCSGCHVVGPDTTPPTSSSNALAAYVSTATVSLYTADDRSGGATAHYVLDGGPERLLPGGQLVVAPPAAGSQSHTLEFWAVDASGNAEAAHHSVAFSVARDVTPPVTTSNAKASYVGIARLRFTATDDATQYGVAATHYRLDGGTDTVGTAVDLPNPAVTATHTVEYWSVDAAGNEETHHTFSFQTGNDSVAPVTSPVMYPTVTAPDGTVWLTFYRLFLTLNATDTGDSGVAYSYAVVDGIYGTGGASNGSLYTNMANDYTFAEGMHTLDYYSIDAAGNREETQHLVWGEDWHGPSTSSDYRGAYAGTATVSITASDTLSGVRRISYRVDSGPYVDVTGTAVAVSVAPPASGQAYHTIYWTAYDNAGNGGNGAAAFYVRPLSSDVAKPTGASVTINGGAASTTSQAVTLTLNASDNAYGDSGMGEMRFSNDNSTWSAWEPYAAARSWALSAGNGTKTAYAQFRDRAGNTTAVVNDTIVLSAVVDSVPPATTSSFVPVAGSSYAATQSVTLSPSDSGGSGLAATYYRIDTGGWMTGTSFQVGGEGLHTFSWYSTDNAGNTEGTHTSAQFRIDLTAPVTSSDAVSGQVYQGTKAFTLSPTDSGSGVAGTWYRLDGGAWSSGTTLTVPAPASGTASHTLDWYSADIAGNREATKTATFGISAAVAPPAAPASLSGTAGDGTASLAWAASAGATDYDLQRATDAGFSSGLATVTPSGTSASDTGLANGTAYWYRVRARNAGGSSGWTVIAAALVPSAPAAPSGTPKATFSYTGSDQSFTVPAGVTAIQVELYGAEGGSYDGVAAGLGGGVHATLPVTPGQVLTVRVGGKPTDGQRMAGGWPNGGTSDHGGAGGGSTSLLAGGSVLVEAGAGGGADHNDGPGGDGGYQGWLPGGNGSGGSSADGAAGGGGWNGGSGYPYHAGGGDGGSSYVASGTGTLDQGVRTGNGLVAIDWADADTTPPVTACSLTEGGSYTGDKSFTLTPADSGSGVASTRWQLDGTGGSWTSATTGTVAAPASGSQSHVLYWYSVDAAGNREATKSVSFTVAAVAAATGDASFSYTGSTETFVVPAGVTSLQVTIEGGGGGGGGGASNTGSNADSGSDGGASSLAYGGTTYRAYGGGGGEGAYADYRSGSDGSAGGGTSHAGWTLVAGGGAGGGGGGQSDDSGGAGGAGGRLTGTLNVTPGSTVTIVVGGGGAGGGGSSSGDGGGDGRVLLHWGS